MIQAPIREILRQIRRLDKPIRQCIILLLIGHFLTEVPSIMEHICPGINNKSVYWFLSPNYHKQWLIKNYLKNSTDDLLWIITFYCFAKIAKLYSTYLFLVLVVFVVYHIIDGLMFWWDFKTGHWFYWDLLFTAIIFIKGIFKPYKPETIAKIKSLF